MEPTPAGGRLLENLLLFGRVLHGLGLEGSPDRMIELATALGFVDLGRKQDVRATMRALVARRREDLPLFEEAFEVFWRAPREGTTSLDLRALGERRRLRRPRFEPPPVADAAGDGASRGAPIPLPAAVSHSAADVLRHKDFAAMTGEELAAVESVMAELTWRRGLRRTRRLRGGRGARLDLRRTLRESLRRGGEVVAWRHRRRRTKLRPLVVLGDISGSMERYTRMLLLFVYALGEGAARGVETFLFGTRLTRVTRQLRGRDVEHALSEVARAVPDWSGGTRIGAALEAFNFEWARRVPLAASVVLLVSDGWDRGDPELLRREIARLQRSCHRLVWLNPLLGDAGYRPLARGARTVRPFVDDFLPVRDLASLEDLARRLPTLDSRRPVRGRRSEAEA